MPVISSVPMTGNPFRMTDRQMNDDDIDDACFEEAVRWHARLRGEDDPALYQQHADWLAQDAAHGRAMDEVEILFGALDIPVARAARREPRRVPRRWQLAAAAALVAAVGAAVSLRPGHDIETRIGETRVVALEDGSEVTLGPSAAIDIHMQAHERRITLAHGEARFRVTHDSSRPFIVDAGLGQTRVLGTVFDVDRTSESTRVSVIEGRVALSDAHGASRVLTARQAGEASASGVHSLDDASAQAQTAWTQGQWVFYQRPLADVVDHIGRYRHGVILLQGRARQATSVSGAFDARTPDTALDGVVAALALQRTDIGPWLTILH